MMVFINMKYGTCVGEKYYSCESLNNSSKLLIAELTFNFNLFNVYIPTIIFQGMSEPKPSTWYCYIT